MTQNCGKVIVAVAVAACLVGAHPVRANGPEVLLKGGTLVPVQSSAVRLVTERVHVSLPVPETMGGHVEVKYHLANTTADSVSLTMGFVTGQSERYDVVSGRRLRDSRFRVLANHEELQARLQAITPEDWMSIVTDPPESVYVWDFAMPPDGRVMLEVSYEIWPWARKTEAGTWYYFTYPASPASLWAGRLASAQFIFTLGGVGGPILECLLTQSDCLTVDIAPAGYAWASEGLMWRFKDWEPGGDFQVNLLVADPEALGE